jgi:hypothetical protein
MLLPDQNVQIQHTCELLRLRAELRAATGGDDLAKVDFLAGLRMAKDLGAGLIELRVGTAMARFLANRGDRGGGRNALAPIMERHDVNSFDGRNARAMLAELDQMGTS